MIGSYPSVSCADSSPGGEPGLSIGTVLADTLLVKNELNSTIFVIQKNMPGAHIVSLGHAFRYDDIKFWKNERICH